MGTSKFFFAANTMDLQGDKAMSGEIVFEIGAGRVVEPSFDGVATAFDSDFVPLAGFVSFLADLGKGIGVSTALAGIEPTAPTFVVNATAPHAVWFIGIDLNLIAVYAAGWDLAGFAVTEFRGGVFFKNVGANLYAGVQAVVAVVFVFENEISIDFFGDHPTPFSSIKA